MEDELASTIVSKTYALSPLDIIPSHLYITNVYFFENSATSKEFSQFMPSDLLRDSFNHALHKFPILLGHLKPRGLNSMDIVVTKENLNIPFYEEVDSDVHFRDVKAAQFHRDTWPKGIREIKDSRAHSERCGSPRLIHVSIHRLAQNSGLAIVIRISHAVFDAKGCVAFTKYWAKLCRELTSRTAVSPARCPSPSVIGQETSPQPLFDRSVMFQHLPADVNPAASNARISSVLLFVLSLMLHLLLSIYTTCFGDKEGSPDQTESHLFRVSRSTLRRLHDVIRHSRPNNGPSPRVSDHDIITALFTMAFAHSREQANALKSKGTVSRIFRSWMAIKPRNASAIVPCDFRHRLGVPDSYTGPCAIGLYVTAPRDLLLGPITAESVARVAVISRDSVDGADRKAIEQFVRRALRVVGLLGAKARVLYALMVSEAFSNQTRLDFYHADFGSGPPTRVFPMAYSNTVAVIMPAAPSSQDIYVYLTLRPEIMGVMLKKEFLREFATLIY